MVDNTVFFPPGLTIPREPVYPSFNPSIFQFSSREDPDAPPCVFTPACVLPHALPAPAVFSLLASSWSCPVESRSEDAHHAPPSAYAPLPRRWPRLSTRLHSLVGWRASASACASLVRGQKPPGSTQTQRHPRLRLSQSAVSVLRHQRCSHPRGFLEMASMAKPSASRPFEVLLAAPR
jgi:hypothetical protein